MARGCHDNLRRIVLPEGDDQHRQHGQHGAVEWCEQGRAGRQRGCLGVPGKVIDQLEYDERNGCVRLTLVRLKNAFGNNARMGMRCECRDKAVMFTIGGCWGGCWLAMRVGIGTKSGGHDGSKRSL